MSTSDCTYIYFYDFSGSGAVPQVLKLSTSHYCYHSNRYIIVSNIAKDKFAYLDGIGYWEYYSCYDLLDYKATGILKKLADGWKSGLIRANAPSIEYHCFARSFILYALYQRRILPPDALVFTHDWDDLVFTKLEPLFVEARKYNKANRGLIATTTIPHGDLYILIQPAFTIVNQHSIKTFIEATAYLTDRYLEGLYNPQVVYSDMRAWAYVWSSFLSTDSGSCLLWPELINEFIFCHNVRNLDGIRKYGTLDSRSVLIPKEYNYLGPGKTHEDFIDITLDENNMPSLKSSLFAQTRLFNAHYSGVEGKYLLFHDVKTVLYRYYCDHPALRLVIDSVIS